MKFCYLIVAFVLSVSTASAQQFGGFPPSTKWKQINTDTTRIIYAAGAGQQADRIATLIHKMAADTFLNLGNRLKKINIILQNRTTLANGYVALAPFRSEYFLVPGSNVFDFGNLPWYENLAIHEYRHVQQYNNFYNGLTKGFYYLFGEGGQALANALTVPDWFFEGDAVHAETALTTQGRGRLPLFLSGYNSLWLEGKNYNWMKLRNGSIKHYVPSHYHVGYLLTNYGYLQYGKNFWQKVTQDASAFKGLFYPFQKAVQKHSGVDYKNFRRNAFDFYKKQLGEEKTEVSKTKTVTNIYFPQALGADSLIYLKTAYNKLPAFYFKNKTDENKIALRGISSEEWFSYKNGTVAYTAYSTHPRWTLTDYSDIVLMNASTGAKQRLTKKQRYYTPDISPSGKKIVAVNINDSLTTQLQILSSNDGSLLQDFSLPYGQYYFNPRFVDEDRIVFSIRNAGAKLNLNLMDVSSGKVVELIPFSTTSIGLPSVNGDTVLFTAGHTGNDELFALTLGDKKVHQLTKTKTGNYYGTASAGSITWSKFTSNGLQLQNAATKSLLWKEISQNDFFKALEQYPVAAPNNILPVGTQRFSEKRYSQSSRLFNFHSWQPNYSDPEFTFSLLSDNILNTFSNEFFYRYNQNETSHGAGWNTAYAALFPVLTAGVEYTAGRDFPFRNNTLTLNQLEARAGYYIPLNFTRGNSYKLLRFGNNYVFNKVMPTGFFKDSIQSQNSSYLHHFINWSHYLPTALQHIYPKLGWSSSFNHRHIINGNGYQFFANSFLYLPSLGNHSIVLNGSFQQRDTASIVFSNRFANARGFQDYNLSRMWKLGANYHFPIVYPDLGAANILYLQRVRGNLFYDFARAYSNDKLRSRDFKSVGGEMYFDTKWWNQLPVTFGFRVSHLLTQGLLTGDNKGSTYFEFILPVNLITN